MGITVKPRTNETLRFLGLDSVVVTLERIAAARRKALEVERRRALENEPNEDTCAEEIEDEFQGNLSNEARELTWRFVDTFHAVLGFRLGTLPSAPVVNDVHARICAAIGIEVDED